MIRLSLLFALLLTPTICFAQNVTSSGAVTIVADDDSINDDGIIEFKSGTSTRLIVNGDGTVNILKRLGINTTSPLALIHLSATYPANTTASQRMIMFTPPGPHPESFVFYQRSTLQGDDATTHSVGWGFNPDSEETGQDGKPAGIQFMMENTFGLGDTANFEVHLESRPSECFPCLLRPWTWTINRKSGEAVVVTSATSHFYGGGWLVNGKPELHIDKTETLSMGPFRQQSDSVIFETRANGGANAKQLRIAPHPNDPAVSQLLFGDSNGIGVANIGGVLEIKKATLPATVSAGPYKVNGTKVLGAQCVVILDSNGSLKDNRRAINAVLACMRSHGLVAP